MATVVPSTADIRNIALVGHGGSGKTSLGEALLFKTGATNRLGSVTEKTSILDFTEEEKEKLSSLESAVCFVGQRGKHINIVDTPGAVDFAGQAISGLAGVETAICVISAPAGVEVNSRKMMERAREYGLARMIVINKIDAENVNLEERVDQIREIFGPQCVPVNLPAPDRKSVVDCLKNTSGAVLFGEVGAAREAVFEAIVSVDDALMEKYLGGEAGEAEIQAAAPKAMAAGVFVPIMFTNAKGLVGITELLDAVIDISPSPLQGKRRELVRGEHRIPLDPAGGAFMGQVFKVMSEPKTNMKYSVVRVHSGKLTSDTQFHFGGDKRMIRPGQLHRMQGAEHPDLPTAVSGDVVALAKLDLSIGDTLLSSEDGTIAMPPLPKPMFAIAIEPKNRGDEDKVGASLKKFEHEDPCFQTEHTATTKELVIRGLGDLHLRTILHKMAKQFRLEVNTKPPRIPYLETITGKAMNVEYTHKKQTGGAGQYGKVVINVLPNERGKGYEFVDKIFGGSIDQPFRVSTDKGVRAQLTEGVLAGYPIVDVVVELIDGKTHPVDSKDIAFQIAGRGAFKEGFMKSRPILLEPVVNIEVTCPDDNVGDIQGDLASRRGRPQGQDTLPGGFALIRALIPLAEVSDYHSRLSSITGGRGSYTMELSHYEPVPTHVQQQIVEQAAKHKAEAHA
ncbi:MAG TPA: elongation factor G [Phycisphaerae bacterium]|jgi:elongation factor G